MNNKQISKDLYIAHLNSSNHTVIVLGKYSNYGSPIIVKENPEIMEELMSAKKRIF